MTKQSKKAKSNLKQLAKEQSTETILSAAAKTLSQRGYAGTTISRVAEAAGVSRGLLHYHFKSKEEMLAKVLQTNMKTSVDMIKTIHTNCNSADNFIENLISAFKSLFDDNPDYFNLFLEGIVTARYSEIVKSELGNLYDSFRNSLKESLCNMVKAGVLSPEIPLDGLATLITGILDGIGIQLATVSGFAENENNWHHLKIGLLVLLTSQEGEKRSS